MSEDVHSAYLTILLVVLLFWRFEDLVVWHTWLTGGIAIGLGIANILHGWSA